MKPDLLLLTDDEILQITEYTRKSDQCKEFARLGIPFRQSRSGRPLVVRDAFLRKMGAVSASNGRKYHAPNLDALRGVV